MIRHPASLANLNIAIAFLGILTLWPLSPAQAQATVSVRVYDSVGRNMDGTVTLRRGSTTRTCRTVTSICQIGAVSAGTYSATLAPVREHAPPAIQVQVPSSGVIALSFRSVPQPPAATAVGTTATMVQTGTGSSGNTGGARPTGQTSTQQATANAMTTAVSGSGLAGMSGALTGNIAGMLGISGTGSSMTPAGMAPACTRGRLLNSGGRPTSGWVQVTAGSARSPRLTVGTDGAFQVCGVAPGRWTISANVGGVGQRQTQTVRAGATLTVRHRRARRTRPRSRFRVRK